MLLVYAYISRQNVRIVIYPCVSGYERMDVQFPFFLFNFPEDSERLQESVSQGDGVRMAVSKHLSKAFLGGQSFQHHPGF